MDDGTRLTELIEYGQGIGGLCSDVGEGGREGEGEASDGHLRSQRCDHVQGTILYFECEFGLGKAIGRLPVDSMKLCTLPRPWLVSCDCELFCVSHNYGFIH